MADFKEKEEEEEEWEDAPKNHQIIVKPKMTRLSGEQIAQLKMAFEAMDENKDGVVTTEQLRNLLTDLGEEMTEDIINELIKFADPNGTGMVYHAEFCINV